MLGLLGCLLCTTCQSDGALGNTTDAAAREKHKNAQFQQLTPEVAAATLEIKAKFDAGLRKYESAERELSTLYEQNSRRLRSHLLAQETFRQVFPFDGEMTLEGVSDLVEQLPYCTKKCGFQTETGTVNYYCPSTDAGFFSYLASISPSSPIITAFHDSYLEKRMIAPEIRQQMLLSGLEELDFTNPDHQLFYALFQLWINEEMRAYALANSMKPAEEPGKGQPE